MLKTLGRYELIQQVGRGAMGEVYKGRDPFIGRLVALKTITTGLLGRPDLLDRFYQEARSSGTLQHPNIVTIYELGKEGEIPFIAMEFLEGESLDKLIEQRPILPLSQKLGYIVPVCRALDYAHKNRIIHRDIKPGNIMLTKDGTVKVVDFGIARAMDDSNTQTNMLIGTLGYMSPQQIRGRRADERSDIWALGVLLYELICYERPFTGANHAELMMNIVEEDTEIPPLREKVPNCPPELEALIGKMLRKDVEQRFQTMEEVLLDVEPFWKKLQEETVAELLVDGERRVGDRDLLGAQDLLKKVLQINSSNTRAKSLLEKINREIKQDQILKRAQTTVEKAAKLFEEGSFQQAGAEAEEALKFGSLFAPDHELFAEARRIAEEARIVQQRLQSSKQRLAAGALTEAVQDLEEARKLKADNTEVRALQKQIHEQAERRRERERLADGLQQARLLWVERRYDECIEFLTALQQQFPQEEDILKLLETVRSDQLELQRQQRLAEARGLLAVEQFEGALSVIVVLEQEYPGDEAVIALRALVAQAQLEAGLRQELRDKMEELRSLVHSADHSAAVALGQNLLREFPDEPEIAELVEFARAEEEKRELEAILVKVRANISAQEFQSAINAAQEGLKRFPGNVELTDLISEVERLSRRDQRVQEHLLSIRRLMSDGALTEAQREIEKAMELEVESAQLRKLQRQVQDQLARRRERERLAAAVQQARKCWAEQRYDECISLLTATQKEFPREQEVVKLLETARNDQAQQIKQGKLGRARDLLAGQKFEEALQVVAELQGEHGGDRAVRNLQDLIRRTQEDFEKQKTLENGIEKLRALIGDEKFAEAVVDGEKLLKTFSNEFEVIELLGFARGEQARIEKKRRLDEQIRSINQMIKDARLPAAIQYSQQALAEYPHNTELLILLDRAKRDQAAGEKQELLERRFKEIQQKIHREELSDAVDLARQTQVTVGPNPAIADLLHKAEWELVQKKRRQTETVQKAQTLLASGNLDEATLVLQEAVKTQLFLKSDVRLSEILEEIEKKQASITSDPPTQTSPPRPPAGGPGSWLPETSEPAKDYVFQKSSPLPEKPPSPSQDVTVVAFSPTPLNASAVSVPPLMAPVGKVVEETNPAAPPSKPEEFTATMASAPSIEEPSSAPPSPLEVKAHPVPIVRPPVEFPKKLPSEIRPPAAPEAPAEIAATKATPPSIETTTGGPRLRDLEDALPQKTGAASRVDVPEGAKRQAWLSGSVRLGPFSAKMQIGIALGLMIFAVGLYEIRTARREHGNGVLSPSEAVSRPASEEPSKAVASNSKVAKNAEPSRPASPNASGNTKLYAENLPATGNPEPEPANANTPQSTKEIPGKSVVAAPSKSPSQTPRAGSNVSSSNSMKSPVIDTRTQALSGADQPARKTNTLIPAPTAPEPPRSNGQLVAQNAPEVNSGAAPSNIVPAPVGKLPEATPSVSSAIPPPSSPAPAGPAVNPTPVKPTEPVSVAKSDPDQQAIRGVVAELSSAFASRNMSQLQRIWPKMGANKNALKNVFDSAQSLSREFHIASITINQDALSATAIGSYEGRIREGGKEFSSSGNFYVRLAKKGGIWLIDDASF